MKTSKTPTKVFVLYQGDYDELRIAGVFSTLEKANSVSNLIGEAPHIGTFEIDDEKFNKYPKGYSMFRVEMDKEGVLQSSLYKMNALDNKDGYFYFNDDCKDSNIVFYIFAKNEHSAAKIADDLRLQLLSSDSWGIDYEEWKAKKVGNK